VSCAILDEALKEAAEAYRQRNPISERLHQLASNSLPGGNTRSSLWYDPYPLMMASGTGSRLTDVDGHIYVDFLGEYTAGIYGHSPRFVQDALISALSRGLSLSGPTILEGELAAEICDRFPSMERVRFTNSGTEANLMAITAARAFTRRSKLLVFEGAYHGAGLSFAPGFVGAHLPFEFLIVPYNDVARAREQIERHAAHLAAVIVEPMLGAGGCVPGSPEFLRGLKEATARHGVLLIFDEIQTARLSRGGRQAVLDISPDLTTIGKFFGGGLPFGAFGGRREVMDIFDPRRPDAIPHAGTFNNNTLTMTSALAAVRGALTSEALEELNRRGERFRMDITSAFSRHDAPFRVTGLGSLMNIHSTITGARGVALRALLFFDMLAQGIYFARRGLMSVSFSHTEQDLSGFLSSLETTLHERRAIFADTTSL